MAQVSYAYVYKLYMEVQYQPLKGKRAVATLVYPQGATGNPNPSKFRLSRLCKLGTTAINQINLGRCFPDYKFCILSHRLLLLLC